MSDGISTEKNIDLEKIIEDTKNLKAYQAAPDKNED